MNQQSWRAGRWLLAVFVAVPLLTALAGCVGGQRAQDGQREIATESDQTDASRRARLRLELAVGYFEQGQTNVALDELKQSLAADPNFADAYNMRGLIYMRLNEPRMAEESFRRAAALNPRDGDVLHNFAWLLCQQDRFTESNQYFAQALASPQYGGQPKTYMAQGICQLRAGDGAAAERSLLRSYELNAANPVTGYNLALLLFERKDYSRAQFYIRRLNNSDQASAESLWLGMKIERRLENRDALLQLGGQLKRRFPASREAVLYDKGAYDE